MSSLKLELMTETMEYLRPVLRETKTVEDTAEAIIPDSCPDATDILHTCGTAFLRGRDLGEGSASVSAGVSASVLVQPDERREPEIVEVYIPMSVKFEDPSIKPGLLSCARVQLRRVDSHLVNPRKVLVRALVAVTLQVWEPCAEEHATDTRQKGIELRRSTAPVKLMTAVGEKSYAVEDTVPMTPEEEAAQLAGWQIELTHTDARLTGARAVLKGTATVTALYLDPQGELRTGQANLPFSQYIDLEDCEEGDELQLSSCLTGAEVEPDAGGGLNVTLQVLSRAEVWAMREVAFVQDLYSLEGQAVPALRTAQYESLLDRQAFTPVGRGTLPGADQAVHTVCLPGELSHTRTGETTEFTLPVTVQILSAKDGALAGGSVRTELTCITQAAPGCRFEARLEDLSAAASPGVDGLDVKVTGTLWIDTYGVTELQEITGGQVEDAAPDKNRPGLIIRRVSHRETLWDIAKQYRTTVSAIEQANELSGDPVPETLLLIPQA